MLIKLAVAILAAVVLFSSTLHAQAQNTSAQLGVPFELGIGDQASIASENAVVAFVDVVEDSRCPSDVVCMWEGQATISVSMQVGRGSQEFILTIGTDESPTATYGQYSVTLVSLEPYPQSSVQTDPDDYVATLVVSMAPVNSGSVFVRAAGDNSAVVAGWNLDRGKGTLVKLTSSDEGTERHVYRFVPQAAECSQQQGRECISGQIIHEELRFVVSVEVIGNKLLVIVDGVLVDDALEIKGIRTVGRASPT